MIQQDLDALIRHVDRYVTHGTGWSELVSQYARMLMLSRREAELMLDQLLSEDAA